MAQVAAGSYACVEDLKKGLRDLWCFDGGLP